VCDEGDRAATLGTSSEFPHEGNNISPWVGQGDSTLGHEEEVASSPCHEVCDDLGVSTPKCNEALALDDPPLETDIIQEVHITEIRVAQLISGSVLLWSPHLIWAATLMG
jgi:hypothetical protein